MTRVAILGGRGHIARTLVDHLPHDWRLQLFSARPEALTDDRVAAQPYEAFAGGDYDLVVNAAGPGDPGVHRSIGAEILRITECFDNMALDYLSGHADAGYINISTGAVYGPDYAEARSPDPVYPLHLDALGEANPYVIAKLGAEAKHRMARRLRIADLRVFGYFSRYINLGAQFFAAQAVSHLCRGHTFQTHPGDFVRDFISPEDLAGLIVWVVEQGIPNAAFDAVSAKPVTKFELLDTLKGRFGLRYVVGDGGFPQRLPAPPERVTSAGKDNINQYFSKAASLDTIVREVEELLCSELWQGRVGADGTV